MKLAKVKLNLGSGEIKNVWCFVCRRMDGKYNLYDAFNNGYALGMRLRDKVFGVFD